MLNLAAWRSPMPWSRKNVKVFLRIPWGQLARHAEREIHAHCDTNRHRLGLCGNGKPELVGECWKEEILLLKFEEDQAQGHAIYALRAGQRSERIPHDRAGVIRLPAMNRAPTGFRLRGKWPANNRTA